MGGGNKAGRFLEVSVYKEGGRKGIIWIPEGQNGRGWCRFAGELHQTIATQIERSRSLAPKVSSLTWFSSRHSFVEVIRKASGVEVRKDLKCLSSYLLDVFLVSASLVKGSGGDEPCTAVDCYELEEPVTWSSRSYRRRRRMVSRWRRLYQHCEGKR